MLRKGFTRKKDDRMQEQMGSICKETETLY